MGYSRAVNLGRMVVASGTAPSDGNGRVAGEDAYDQTVFAIKKIEAALREIGASMDDVFRTRIYTTNISLWKEIARAHRRFFRSVKPANTRVQISRLIDSKMLVEVEADAITG
jgi:enamine deaminase RidA (YjgF/YER057c/UK114 family)